MTTPRSGVPAVESSLSAGAAVRLVAGREISTRIRSRSFIVTTVLFVVAIVAGGFLLKLAGSSSSELTVGLTPDNASLAPAVVAVAKASGVELTTTDVPDQKTGEQQVSDGDLDALLTGPPTDFGVTVNKTEDSSLEPILNAVAQQAALATEVTSLGGDPATVSEAIATSTPKVTALDPQPERDAAQIIAGFIAGILIFMSIMICGQLVSQGVVEEKSSRVVELLLAAVKPWQLMAGKVLGIGLIGLIQVVAVVGAGAVTAFTQGLVDSSALNLGTTALWALIWYIVGFTMYALVFAALGALVSRQEDVGAVTGPVTAVIMIPYMLGVTIAPWDPTNPLIVWMSYVPFCSPMLMPIRVALDTVGTAEALGILALNLAFIPLLIWLGGRIYSNAVLRTGARIKLGDALRAA